MVPGKVPLLFHCQLPGDLAEANQTSLKNYEQNGPFHANSEDYHSFISTPLARLHPIDAGPLRLYG